MHVQLTQSTTAEQLASRFLAQTTFGPTMAEVRQLSSTTATSFSDWVEQQMALPPTLHRAHFRQRANPRTQQDLTAGDVRAPCATGSRWLRFALTENDVHKTVTLSYDRTTQRVGWTIDGVLRTTCRGCIPSAYVGTHVICEVAEA
eukprot:1944696-Prymnesium_polylepis.1